MKSWIEFLRRALLERGHLAPLRVHARHDVLDRAVFAGRVHRLEDEQQGPAVLGVEHVLLFGQPSNAALEDIAGLALVQLQATGVARIEVLEPEALAFGDAVWVDILLDTVENFFSRHAAALFLEAQSAPLDCGLKISTTRLYGRSVIAVTVADLTRSIFVQAQRKPDLENARLSPYARSSGIRAPVICLQ